MREILFRGKRVDNGEWVVGSLLWLESGRAMVIPSHTNIFGCDIDDIDESIIQTVAHRVIPETVGQYTGLADKNGMKIFEGDIINFVDELYIVQRECDTPGGYWAENGHILKRIGWTDYISFTDAIDNYENECQIFIVGNIHDNPELLDGVGNG